MATYELWTGGNHRRNDDYAMWPNRPLLAADNIQAADHKQGLHYGLTRVLDFRTAKNDQGDQALQDFVRKNPIITADVLNIVAIPADHTVIELHWAVVSAATTGLTFSLNSAADGAILAATAGDVLASGVETAAGWPNYVIAHDMIDLTFDNIPAGGIGEFKVQITPVVRHYNMGQY